MAVPELCSHLRLLSEKLGPVSNDDSYRVGRIWQNIRLDMPCIQNPSTRTFTDGDNYPPTYPTNRGVNVSTKREVKFVGRIQSELPKLQSIADRARSGLDNDVLGAISDYFGKIIKIWADEPFFWTDDGCNGNNCASTTSLPPQLSRYVDFRSFVRYTLLPTADSVRWTSHDADDFLHQLSLEKANPGKHWVELAAIWKDVRDRIRSGAISFALPSRYNRGDVKFVGDGSAPVHQSSSQPLGSSGRIHHVIKHLALPGWETQNERNKKLGMVALAVPNDTLRAYRPTILDNFGFYSYFFLPGCSLDKSGTTWKLTDDLQKNSETDHGGLPEWTAIVQNPGINCVANTATGPQPAFELVGLEFGIEHALLFEL